MSPMEKWNQTDNWLKYISLLNVVDLSVEQWNQPKKIQSTILSFLQQNFLTISYTVIFATKILVAKMPWQKYWEPFFWCYCGLGGQGNDSLRRWQFGWDLNKEPGMWRCEKKTFWAERTTSANALSRNVWCDQGFAKCDISGRSESELENWQDASL